jgi:DnaK suppressor protein
MKKADLKLYKERLLYLRSRLRNDVNQMADSVHEKAFAEAGGSSSFMPTHMAEIGTDNCEREFTLSLLETKDRTLEQIEDALERVEDGYYGVCEQCEAKIPKARLNVIPYATLCVKCAFRLELS